MKDNALAVFQHMVDFPNNIKDIYQSGNEYYFRYAGHIFSLNERIDPPDYDANYSGFVYPGCSMSPSELAQHYDDGQPYGEIPLVRYSGDGPQGEGFSLVFSKLYKIIVDRYLDLDSIFSDVLSTR